MSIEAAPHQSTLPSSPKMEFGTNYDKIADPTILFEYDKNIGHYEDLQPSAAITIPEQPITSALDWMEEGKEGDGMHNLRAVFNYRGNNFGVVDTKVDGKPFTYVTTFGRKGDEDSGRGQMVYVLDGDDTEVHMYDHSDKMEGHPNAVVSLRRTEDGKLELVSQGVYAVRVGTVSAEQVAERKRAKEGFSLRSAYEGLKRFVKREAKSGTNIDQRRWDSKLTQDIPAWKAESSVPTQWARWWRHQKQLQTV